MVKYALYEGRKLVRVAGNLNEWEFHPYHGDKGFIEVTEEQAGRLEQELLNREELEKLIVQN